jgi:hypothetical protein
MNFPGIPKSWNGKLVNNAYLVYAGLRISKFSLCIVDR